MISYFMHLWKESGCLQKHSTIYVPNGLCIVDLNFQHCSEPILKMLWHLNKFESHCWMVWSFCSNSILSKMNRVLHLESSQGFCYILRTIKMSSNLDYVLPKIKVAGQETKLGGKWERGVSLCVCVCVKFTISIFLKN